MDLSAINTIVLLMFENRSFDHMLGHLSYDGIRKDINGYQKPLNQYENIYKGDVFNPFKLRTDANLAFDIPHEYDEIAVQLGKSAASGRYRMDGFVKAYLDKTGEAPNRQSPPMGFFKREQVPVTSFLAETYSVCDAWYAPLPSSTQPNRTMAFCGESSIHQTKLQLVKATGNMFDWMKKNGVKWRVYHDGLSFFVLYNQLWKYVLDKDYFSDYENLFRDFKEEDDNSFPQVIVVEPSYYDAPHIGPDHPNDNHAPLAVGWGEDFLRRTYDAVTANPKRWGNTLMVVYYDEHGGFYDHQTPPRIGYDTTASQPFHFDSLGVRIPGLLVSPWVKRGQTSSLVFDHTSVLQLLAEKFTPGKTYSASVENRRKQGINSLSAALTDTKDATATPVPQQSITVKSMLGDTIHISPDGSMGQAFEQATLDMMRQLPEETKATYPELLQWRDTVQKTRGLPAKTRSRR